MAPPEGLEPPRERDGGNRMGEQRQLRAKDEVGLERWGALHRLRREQKAPLDEIHLLVPHKLGLRRELTRHGDRALVYGLPPEEERHNQRDEQHGHDATDHIAEDPPTPRRALLFALLDSRLVP